MSRIFSKGKFNHHPLLWVTLLAVVLIASIGFVTHYKTPIMQTISLASTHRPEPYTELYFTGTNLPQNVKVNTLTVVTFHITNHEAVSKTYHYSVSQSALNSVAIIAVGNVTLSDGAGVNRQITFKVLKPHTLSNLNIRLIGTDQQINFRTQS